MTDPIDQTEHQQASLLLRHATSDLTPDVDRLVAHAITRGRRQRRRRRVGTSFAAVAVIGVIGLAASVGPGLLRDDATSSSGVGFADDTTSPDPAPTTPEATESDAGEPPYVPIDALVTVSAEDMPSVAAALLPEGVLGPTLKGPPFGITDLPQEKIVHFLWDGTLTTLIIERADSLVSCDAQAAEATDSECVTEGGVQLLRTGPTTADQVTAQGVSAWVHGFIVTAMSYNAADGKDVAPVTDVPPISMADLTMLATSDVWFQEP